MDGEIPFSAAAGLGHRYPAPSTPAARRSAYDPGVSKVSYERVGAAAVLTITRPERRNAVDDETAGLLLDGFHRFESDDQARILVLTGEGPDAFCAGADLKAFAERAAAFRGDDPEAEVDEWLDARPDGPLGFTRLQASKPTIAAISGWCLAGGLELALWCDLRIATDTARLGFTERRFGVPLIDGGTQRLPRLIGLGRALEMILTGRVVEASEANLWGLVTEVVSAGAHLDRALEVAEGLAAFPQTTMLSDRRAAIEGIGLPFADGLALEAKLGRASVITGAAGAARFATGEGRGAEGAGV
jgi:enoyl-CoA hydratase